MKTTNILAGLLLAMFSLSAYCQTTAKSLFPVDVADATNQEIVVLEVTYPPGGRSSSHRHNAHTVVYVLEGQVNMAVEGGETRTLGPGEVFYENPEDIHTVSMNASNSKPAKILVYFLKTKGTPSTEPSA